MTRTGFACLNLFLLALSLPPRTNAQSTTGPQPPASPQLPTNATTTDTSATDTTGIHQAILIYTQNDAAKVRLYNGPLYAGYDLQTQGHPFFQSDSPLTGSITYDGVYFPGIPLSYDLEKDLVVIPDQHNVVKIQLVTEKLTSFTIGDHKFIHLYSDSTANLPAEGFYELLYASPDPNAGIAKTSPGKTIALARFKKVLQQSGKAEERSHYQQYDSWYLQHNGRFYPIHSNRDLLGLPGAPRDALKDYLKKNRISFKKNPSSALVKTAEFYSQSTH